MNDENPADVAISNSSVMRCSGDVVDVDKSGNIYYVGRTDDQIKFNGVKVSLSDLEARVSSLLTSSSAVWDSSRSQVILACVRDSSSVVNDDILSHIASLSCPLDLFFMQDLPLTSHGKYILLHYTVNFFLYSFLFFKN